MPVGALQKRMFTLVHGGQGHANLLGASTRTFLKVLLTCAQLKETKLLRKQGHRSENLAGLQMLPLQNTDSETALRIPCLVSE